MCRCDDARHYRAVAIKVPGTVVPCHEIPANDVVDVAITVIIEPVVRDFVRIAPDILRIDVTMMPVEPRIDDSNDDGFGVSYRIPSGRLVFCEADTLDGPLIVELRAPGVAAVATCAPVVGIGWNEHDAARIVLEDCDSNLDQNVDDEFTTILGE